MTEKQRTLKALNDVRGRLVQLDALTEGLTDDELPQSIIDEAYRTTAEAAKVLWDYKVAHGQVDHRPLN